MSPLLSSLVEALKDKADQAEYIIYVKDAQDKFIWMNTSAENALKSKDGEKLRAALFANDLNIIKENKCISKVYFIDENNPFNKTNRSFAFSKWPVESEEGGSYIVGFGFEITNWLVEESTLNFYRNVLNSMTDSFVITEPYYPYEIVYCNSAFESLSGRTRKEIIGKTPTTIFKKYSEDDQQRKIFNQRLKNFEVAEAVFKNRNWVGYEFVSSLKVIPLYFDEGDEPNYLMGIQRDISSTFALRQASRDKTNKLNALFNATSNFIWLLNQEGCIVEMNDAARIQGRYLDNCYEDFKFFNGRWWQSNRPEIKSLIERASLDCRYLKTKTKMTSSLDTEIPIQLSITPILEGQTLKFLVVEGVDISELETALSNAKSVAAGALKNAFSEEYTEVDENYLREFSNNQIERIVTTEVGMRKLEPEVRKLNEAVFDPEAGLVVRTESIDKNVGDIKEALVNPGLVKFVKNIPSILDNRVVRWALILILGAAGVNVVENFSHKVEYIWNEIRELEENVNPETKP